MQQTIQIYAGCGDGPDPKEWSLRVRFNDKWHCDCSVPMRHNMGPLTPTVLVQFLRDVADLIDGDQELSLDPNSHRRLFGEGFKGYQREK